MKFNLLISEKPVPKKPKAGTGYEPDTFQETLNSGRPLNVLAREVTVPEYLEEARQGKVFLPVIPKANMTERKDDYILGRNVIFLDNDGFLTWEDALKIIEANKIPVHAMHTSSSHLLKPGIHKFRIIIILDRMVDKETYKYNAQLIGDMFGGFEKHRFRDTPEGKRKKEIIKEGLDPVSLKQNQIMYGFCNADNSENWKCKEWPDNKPFKAKKIPAAEKKRIEKEKQRVKDKTEAIKSSFIDDDFYAYSLHKAFKEGDQETFGGMGSGTYENYITAAYNFTAAGKMEEFKEILKTNYPDRPISLFNSIFEKVDAYFDHDYLEYIDGINKAKISRLRGDNGQVILESLLLDFITKSETIFKDVESGYYYDTDHKRYKIFEEVIQKNIISNHYQDHENIILPTGLIKELQAQYEIKNKITKRISSIPERENENEVHIPFLDGTLIFDIAERGKRTFLKGEWPRHNKPIISFNYKYSEVEECKESRLNSFIEAIIPNKTDRKITKLMLGSILYPYNFLPFILILLGRKGGEGKDTIFEAIQEVIPDLYSTTPVEDFGDDKKAVNFVNKICNFSPEIDSENKSVVKKFKVQIGGADMNIDDKYIKRYAIKNNLKYFTSSNKPIAFTGLDEAALRRILMVECFRSSDYTNIDPSIKQAYLKDHIGTIKMLLDYLETFIKYNMQIPAMREAMKMEIITGNSLANEYFEDNIILGNEIDMSTFALNFRDQVENISAQRVRKKLEIWCKLKNYELVHLRTLKGYKIYLVRAFKCDNEEFVYPF